MAKKDQMFKDYEKALEKEGYRPLTINSYVSAAHRFVDFVDTGKVEKEREVRVLD